MMLVNRELAQMNAGIAKDSHNDVLCERCLKKKTWAKDHLAAIRQKPVSSCCSSDCSNRLSTADSSVPAMGAETVSALQV